MARRRALGDKVSDNVVSIQEYRPHLAGPARCLQCRHEWVAVAPVGVYAGLECPECHFAKGAMCGFVNLASGIAVFRCDCGCDIFKIYMNGGPLCLNCGEFARGHGT